MKSKRIRELQQMILVKSAEMETCLTGENKDITKASGLNDEIAEAEAEMKLLQTAIQREKAAVPTQPAETQKTSDSIKAFADAARNGFRQSLEDVRKNMSEGVDADGGYTVPEDIRTKIETYRDAKFSLRQLVSVENVTTKSGRRTFKLRAQQTGFARVAEGGKMTRKANPQFGIISYEIGKYMGYLPVTNELLADSDTNITNEIVQWLGDESRVTDNRNIIAKIEEKTPVMLETMDDIDHVFIVTLGQAFRSSAKLVTNDDGLFWLDTRKDANGRKLLAPDPANAMQMRLAVGASYVPIEIVPNQDWASTPVYTESEDTAVKSGKTYYTRSGSGTSSSPYVYAVVSDPTTPKTNGYYELTGKQIPFVCGDLAEGIRLFDRQRVTIRVSTDAVVGSGADQVNAFEQDMTIFAGALRQDVQERDSDAYVYGLLTVEV